MCMPSSGEGFVQAIFFGCTFCVTHPQEEVWQICREDVSLVLVSTIKNRIKCTIAYNHHRLDCLECNIIYVYSLLTL